LGDGAELWPVLHRDQPDRLAFRIGSANIQGMFDKDARRGFPSVSGGEFQAGLRRNQQRRQAGQSQIVVQRADRRGADDVAGTGHRKGCDRQAAGERFQQHETKCVGLARKHEHVGGRIGLSQRLALPRAEEDGLRIFSRQRGACRTARPLPNLSPGRRQTESELWQRGIALNFVGDHPRRKELLRSQNVLMHFSQGSANRSISGVRLRGDVADSSVDLK